MGKKIKLENYLSNGNYINGGPWNGSEDITWDVFSRSNNIGGSIVNRDATGSFEASIITSNLVGDVTGDVTGDASGSSESVTGNAPTCTNLETPRIVDIRIEGMYIGSGTLGLVGGTIMNNVALIEAELGDVDISNLDPLPE